jgi:putative DNA primase/helicase
MTHEPTPDNDDIGRFLDELEKPPPRKRTSRVKSEGNGLDAAPEFTEDALALSFASRHAGELRYVAAWGRWLMWTGERWEFENTLAAFDMARKLCREAAGRCNKPSEANNLSKGKTVAAVEALARSDRMLAATKDQWDTELLSLNT